MIQRSGRGLPSGSRYSAGTVSVVLVLLMVYLAFVFLLSSETSAQGHGVLSSKMAESYSTEHRPVDESGSRDRPGSQGGTAHALALITGHGPVEPQAPAAGSGAEAAPSRGGWAGIAIGIAGLAAAVALVGWLSRWRWPI